MYRDEINSAISVHRAGDLEGAKAIYEKLLLKYPADPNLFQLLGTLECQSGNPSRGEYLLGKSIDINPSQPGALNNRGNALKNLQRFQEALECFRRAIEIRPDFAEAYNNIGNALCALGDPVEAVNSYNQAIKIKPGYGEAYKNRGNAYKDQHKFDNALSDYEKSSQLSPGDYDVQLCKGLLLLTLGDFEAGLPLYEARWHGAPPVINGKAMWRGETPLEGKTLLVHSEQGLGDVIMMLRYMRVIENSGGQVLLSVPESLHELLRNMDGGHKILTNHEANAEFDLHIPVLSLPLAFHTRVSSIPRFKPFGVADKNAANVFETQINSNNKLKIGIAWSGNPSHKNDYNRSIPLKKLDQLFSLDCDFHALQKDIRIEDSPFVDRYGIKNHGDFLKNFADAAALMSSMDVIVSVDTSIAHLAGIMGKPVLIMLPFMPDFRWLLNRSDSPWYPSATLIRQPRLGDWDGVVMQVKEHLESLIFGVQNKSKQ